MGELMELSNDINVITAEINSYKQVAGQAIFEIGRRLKHVKYNPKEYGLPEGQDKNGDTIVARGYWGDWLKSLDIHWDVANKMIKIIDKIGDSNSYTYMNSGMNALYLIATLPEGERDREHIIPSTGEQKTVDEMTVRELREVKKALKQAKEDKKRLEQEKQALGQQLTEERNKPTRVETKTVERVVDNTDYETINKLNKQINVYQQRLNSIERQKELLEERLQQEEKDANEYKKLKRELEDLHSKKDDLHRQIESATSISGLVVEIEHMLQNKLAPVKYSRAISEKRHDQIVIDNLNDIVNRVYSWCDEMKSLIPKENNNTIDAEVIEYE